MKYNLGDQIKVIHINYEHGKRVQPPLPRIIGMHGVIIKPSLNEEKAYHIKLVNGKNVLLYDDEIKKLF